MDSMTTTYVLPTQHLDKFIHDKLANEHLSFEQMLTYAACYIEHEDGGVAGSIYAADIENFLYDDISGYDCDFPGDPDVLSYTQHCRIKDISAKLADNVLEVGVELRPIIQTYLDIDVYEKYTTDAAALCGGDLLLRLRLREPY